MLYIRYIQVHNIVSSVRSLCGHGVYNHGMHRPCTRRLRLELSTSHGCIRCCIGITIVIYQIGPSMKSFQIWSIGHGNGTRFTKVGYGIGKVRV